MALLAWLLPVASLLGLLAGLLIGAIGVGGIILVPCLLELPLGGNQEEALATAVSSSMFSYMFAGAAGAAAYSRRRSLEWRGAGWLVAGAGPGGALGALLLTATKAIWVKGALYSLVVLSATHSVYRAVADCRGAAGAGTEATPGEAEEQTSQEKEAKVEEETESKGEDSSCLAADRWSGRLVRVAVGLVVGAGSALTGTSGPVILLPILLSLGWPTLEALGSAQAVQAPLAAAATLAFLLQGGGLNWPLGCALAAGLVPGVLGGAVAAHRLPVGRLRLGVAAVLAAAGALGVARLLHQELTRGEEGMEGMEGMEDMEDSLPAPLAEATS